MATGTVKWFNNAKGYGFILPETGEGDLFVHYSSIQMDGYRTLKAGQAVSFEIVEGPKGGHATNIQTLDTGDGGTLERPVETTREPENTPAVPTSSDSADENQRADTAKSPLMTPDLTSEIGSDAPRSEELAEPH